MFTLLTRLFIGVAVPLGLTIGKSVAVVVTDWREGVPVEQDSPVRPRYARGFGAMFPCIGVVDGLVNAQFGTLGLLVMAGLAGFVFSAGGTTAVLLLCRSEGIGAETPMLAVCP